MSRFALFFLVFGTIALGSGRVFADEVLSGKISEEAGLSQEPGAPAGLYQYTRVLLETHDDFWDSFSFHAAGEYLQLASTLEALPTWPTGSDQNFIDLEANDFSSLEGERFQSLRLSRAFVKGVFGPLEATAGLQSFNWGSSHFYQPTDYFYPLSPLAWMKDQPLGSEALDADCFLLDDFSLEGAIRWLRGGQSEEVLRLVNKGIGLTITPSFAWLEGRNGFGLELSGTFPDFQVRLEGVDWLYADGSAQPEWVAGFSTVYQGTAFTLEALDDRTGRILGLDSDRATAAVYFFASMEKTFTAQWKAAPALVKSLDGGPFLFWPKATWGFAASWELGFQSQILIGKFPGPLALEPGRTGISVATSF